MEKIHIIARFKINTGKSTEFQKGADKCIVATRTESGALLYDWFIDEQNLECTVVETYKDSEAVLIHADNVNEPLSKLMEIADLSLEVFGDPSAELRKVLKDMNVTAKPFFKSL